MIGAVLLITAHRSPAPITETAETPTRTPLPKPSQAESAEEKVKARKPKPKTAENQSVAKQVARESAKAPVTGTWVGQWDNSRGENGGVKIKLSEAAGGIITGDAGFANIANGHRIGNVVTYTFHRWGRDYQVMLTLSPDGNTMNGGYKVTQGQKLIYTGKYTGFKRR